MKAVSINQQITLAGFLTLIKTAVVGFAASEIWFFSRAIAKALYRYVGDEGVQAEALIVCGCGLVLVIAYLEIRNCRAEIVKISQSYRADILVMLLLGVLISISFGGVGSSRYQLLVDLLRPSQLLLLLMVPLVIGLLLVFRALVLKFTQKADRGPPFFISDVEQKTANDDLLNFSEDAARFAERVLNGGAPDSIVFGIDAPWGIGKSTFVNLCIEYWENKHRASIIVYRFNLLRYEDQKNLVEKFVDGLVRTIQKDLFIPEIRPLVSQYSRFIRGRGSVSQLGFTLELQPRTYTVDDAFDDLEAALSNIKKKIIIVVDDLDRVSFATIKNVLFAIKKSFTLPNISYVLCYDTENIVSSEAQKDGAEQVREFLEKFVNVKISLFLHTDTLSQYISQNFESAVRNNLQLDPYTLGKIKEAISAIVDIYKSPSFHIYQEFLGDVRKLKRLINTLVLFEIEKTDFENSDIDKHDLIHLLLIYINFPDVFRKIYGTETDGKRGFFSLVTRYDDNYPRERSGQGQVPRDETRYKNSTDYIAYVTDLPAGQKMLLERVFSASIRLKDSIVGNVPEEDRKTFACFNGDFSGTGGRNLEEYLNLIVKLSKPQRRDQYRYYLNARNRLANGEELERILQDNEFAFSNSEYSRQQFWRIVVNTAREFKGDLGHRIIRHLLDHIPDYSVLSHEKLGDGLRDDIPYFIIKLLDVVGWADPSGTTYANTPEHIAAIADWILGEGAHENNGVLAKLGDASRGPLGLFDVMLFRLSCCANRGGDSYNLQRALSLHGDPRAPTAGSTDVIVVEEMREMSQRIFQMFKSQYIAPRRNLFELIDQLTLQDLAGNYFAFVESQLKSSAISQDDIDRAASRAKTRLMAFITYQLGSEFLSQGIGCGYYDETGKADEKGIGTRINDYLFNVCFAPAGDQSNIEHLLDYLLISFSSSFEGQGGVTYRPSIEGFTNVLKRDRLINYWRENASTIRSLNLRAVNKRIVTANYIATYNEDLPAVYELLDQLVAGDS